MGLGWSEIIVAAITMLGGGGMAGAIVSAIRGRKKDDVDVTKALREMSKEAVRDVRSDMHELKGELRQIREVLTDLVDIVESDVVPVLRGSHPHTVQRLRLVTARARDVV